MKKSLKLLLENLWIKYNYKLLLTVSLIILTSFTEGLSVIFLIPLFNKLGFENAITSDLLNNLFKFIDNFIVFDWVGILSIIFILCFTQFNDNFKWMDVIKGFSRLFGILEKKTI